jgi:hypothetical protein
MFIFIAEFKIAVFTFDCSPSSVTYWRQRLMQKFVHNEFMKHTSFNFMKSEFFNNKLITLYTLSVVVFFALWTTGQGMIQEKLCGKKN